MVHDAESVILRNPALIAVPRCLSSQQRHIPPESR